MSTRTVAQALGSQGQSLVTHIINSTGDWIARAQDEDYGIDLEAELAVPEVAGQLIKVQVKASRSVEIAERGVVCQIPRSLAFYADSCRLPVILVRVDLDRQQAWFLWLQQWLLERQRNGLVMQSLPESVTCHIPTEHTLENGLTKELRDIAQWRTETQLVLTVHDAIRTSAAVYNYGVLDHLVALLDQIGIVNEHFPINLVIDQAISLGADLRGTYEGNQASRTLYSICRHFGKYFSADQIWRMVTRQESTSRTGLNALGMLYDEAYEHTAGLDLVQRFLTHTDRRVAFYCNLRERKAHASFLELIRENMEVQFADLAIDPQLKEDLFGKWPNRGDAVILDYLYSTAAEASVVPE